jgi:hypothetical protein
MRSLRYATAAPVLVLAVTGIALAAKHDPTTKQVAAKFSTTPQRVVTKTCTGSDGSYTVTDGTYNGTISGTLTGGSTDTLTIHAKSIVNQTTGDGTTVGHFRIKNGVSPVADGSLTAVDSGSGSLNGFLVAHVPAAPPPPPPAERLLANFSGTLGAGGIAGTIGGNGSMTNTAVEQSGSCPPHPRPHHLGPRPHHPAPPPHVP